MVHLALLRFRAGICAHLHQHFAHHRVAAFSRNMEWGLQCLRVRDVRRSSIPKQLTTDLRAGQPATLISLSGDLVDALVNTQSRAPQRNRSGARHGTLLVLPRPNVTGMRLAHLCCKVKRRDTIDGARINLSALLQ